MIRLITRSSVSVLLAEMHFLQFDGARLMTQ